MERSETRLHTMIEANADGIVLVNAKRRVIFTNRAAREMFQFSTQDFHGSRWPFSLTVDTTSEVEIQSSRFEGNEAGFVGGAIEAFGRIVWSIEDVEATLRDWSDRSTG